MPSKHRQPLYLTLCVLSMRVKSPSAIPTRQLGALLCLDILMTPG
jgi:hypothetical protein